MADTLNVQHKFEGHVIEAEDNRNIVAYLIAPESRQYIAIMDILEASITDLTPDELDARLIATGQSLGLATVQARLDMLREWRAVLARPDTSKILRHADLFARNWRYTATPIGRQVQRFYRTVLIGAATVREIPLESLRQAVEAIEQLVALTEGDGSTDKYISQLFVNHEAIDAALVGAEDNLASLADRFDLNDEATAELKEVLVNYATHIALELDRGATRALRGLNALRPRFAELANLSVQSSEAKVLIERGALAAARGRSVADWEGLLAWFDPVTGRAERFAFRLVRALPGMHMNLRRLHSSAGMATSRSRALALAKACFQSHLGPALLLAAVGDHPWRKLHGEAEEIEGIRARSWRDGPFVDVPELVRTIGRGGARGKVPAARDDSSAREHVRQAREFRKQMHERSIREVLSTVKGAALSEEAARVALAALLSAVRSMRSSGRRMATCEGLSCTITDSPKTTGLLRTHHWSVRLPGRNIAFHLPGRTSRDRVSKVQAQGIGIE